MMTIFLDILSPENVVTHQSEIKHTEGYQPLILDGIYWKIALDWASAFYAMVPWPWKKKILKSSNKYSLHVLTLMIYESIILYFTMLIVQSFS